MLASILAVCVGACAGAITRWLLCQALNSIFPALPLGTLAVNLAGGWIMGFALGAFAFFPALDEHWRLLVATGFLGSLSTLSSFAAEMSALILQGRLVLCACGIGLHVAGSICMLFLGMGAFNLLKKFL